MAPFVAMTHLSGCNPTLSIQSTVSAFETTLSCGAVVVGVAQLACVARPAVMRWLTQSTLVAIPPLTPIGGLANGGHHGFAPSLYHFSRL